jgi:hypothetical protein
LEDTSEFFRWLVGGLIALWLGLISWLGKRQVDRIDELDRNAIRKDAFKETRDDVKALTEVVSAIRIDQARTLQMLEQRRKRISKDE